MITIYNKKNSGLSYSRNIGLENATGSYIGYIDSDDYVDLDNYEIDGTNYKLSKYNYFILTIDGKEIASYELFKKDTLKLKKDDKIKFDEKLNVCYIIREA